MTAARDLVIVGAGGLGREVAAAVAAMNAVEPTYVLRGFLDDAAPDGSLVDGVPVLGPVEPGPIDALPDAHVVVCAGSAANRFVRRRLVDRLGLPAERYGTVVHPSASIPPGSSIGRGSVVLAAVVATTATEVGEHTVVMPAVVLTHDDVVGRFVTFGAGARLAGRVTADDGAYVGAGAVVREGCRVGAWSLVGMGAVVLRDVPPAEAWVGNPARRLRALELPPGLPPVDPDAGPDADPDG